MIKKLKIKFICIMLGSIFLVLLIVFCALNYYMLKSSQEQTRRVLDFVIQSGRYIRNNDSGNSESSVPPSDDKIVDGSPPANNTVPANGAAPAPEGNNTSPAPANDTVPANNMRQKPVDDVFRASKVFYIKYSGSGEVLEVNLNNVTELTEDQAVEYGGYVLKKGNGSGTYKNYQYLTGEKSYGSIVAFSERGIENTMLRQLMIMSAAVILGGMVIFLFISIQLANWAVRPVQTAFDRQRQFISDASHELKTPITVISANADVLESEIGENKWLSYIKSQSSRMNLLVNDLLTLAKTDEAVGGIEFTEFDLSAAATGSILSFESIAFESGKEFTVAIQPDIRYRGNEAKIKQLLSILADNAIKHSDKNGKIDISVRSAGNKVVIDVSNTTAESVNIDKEKIFERFYRGDSSRSRETGGYGLGLAIAKSIVELHKGKIEVLSEKDKRIKFVVTL